MALRRPNPPHFRQHDGNRFGRHNVFFGKGPGFVTLHQRRTAIVAVLLGGGGQFLAQQVLHAARRTQRLLQVIALFGKLVLLAANFHFFQFRQVAQLQFQNRFSLNIADTKTRHQHRLGLVLFTNDGNDFINIEKGDQQAIEDMQSLEHFIQTEFQTAPGGLGPKLQPLIENAIQTFYLRATINADHIQVNPVAALQIGGRKQVVHQRLGINAIRARHNHQPRWVFVVGLVA